MSIAKSVSQPSSQPTSKQIKFVLNIAPVVYEPDIEIACGLFPYESHEQLRLLREKHRSTHVVRRHQLACLKNGLAKNQIIAIPTTNNSPRIGENFFDLKLSENLGHTAALVRESLISFFAAFPRRVFDYRPVKVMCDEVADNLLRKSIPKGISCPDWLGVSPVFEIEVRVIEAARDKPYIGICLNAFLRRRIDATCEKLIADGLDLIGHYVGKRIETSDPRIDPKFQLAGRVTKVQNGVMTLEDHREDAKEIDAASSYVEIASFDSITRQVFGSDYRAIKAQLDNATMAFRQGEEKLRRIGRLRSYIEDHPLELIDGRTWTCGEFVSQGNEGFPQIQQCPPVTYVFDSRKTDSWPVRGIDQNGPYSAPVFSPTEPSVCIICQKEHRGRIEQFVHKFIHGIPQSRLNGDVRAKRQSFDNGFVRKYAIQNVKTEFFEANGKTAADYRKAIHRAFKWQTDNKASFDLALVEIEESFHELHGELDPYLVAKAEFLSHQIPVQEFEFETTEMPEARLHYALNNMALATYAKLGGTPWLVQANPAISHELVIGLGSTSVGSGRLGERERIVGITTVFSGDGNYCVSTLSKAVAFEDYESELLASLKETIERVSKSMNWQPKSHVRLVFHSFKPFKNTEEEAVKKLVNSLGDYQVEYAFLDVVEQHPFVLFDRSQLGTRAYDGSNRNKGVLAPERGQFMRLSSYETLVVLTGPKELKQSSDGMPSPILLRLGRGSTFKDLFYLTKQVNIFACHSWRGFDNSPLPVTLGYSNLIARLLGKLGQVSYWNPSQMYGKIGETRWFL